MVLSLYCQCHYLILICPKLTDYHQTMAYLNFGKEGRGVEVVGWGVGGRWAPSPEKIVLSPS